MTTRKTTNNYKVTIEQDERIDDFNLYDVGDFCFKDVSRDYKLPNDLNLADWEIDYLINGLSLDDVDDYYTDEQVKNLDNLKKNKILVWLSFWDYGWWCICVKDYDGHHRWYDGIMILDKWDEDITKSVLKHFNHRLTGEIYVVWIYESKEFRSDDGEIIKRWDFIDWQSGFMDYEDAKNSLPDYIWDLIESTESERFDMYD